MVRKNLFGSTGHEGGTPGHAGYLDAITLTGRTRRDLPEKDDANVPRANRHIVVLYAGTNRLEVGHFMIVGREERTRANDVVQMLCHTPSNRKTVKSRCPTADLIQDHQAAIGRIVDDVCSFIHFHHESG